MSDWDYYDCLEYEEYLEGEYRQKERDETRINCGRNIHYYSDGEYSSSGDDNSTDESRKFIDGVCTEIYDKKLEKYVPKPEKINVNKNNQRNSAAANNGKNNCNNQRNSTIASNRKNNCNNQRNSTIASNRKNNSNNQTNDEKLHKIVEDDLLDYNEREIVTTFQRQQYEFIKDEIVEVLKKQPIQRIGVFKISNYQGFINSRFINFDFTSRIVMREVGTNNILIGDLNQERNILKFDYLYDGSEANIKVDIIDSIVSYDRMYKAIKNNNQFTKYFDQIYCDSIDQKNRYHDLYYNDNRSRYHNRYNYSDSDDDSSFNYYNNQFNSENQEQEKVINFFTKSSERNGLFCVQGPPGTGKSYMIEQLLNKIDGKILICSPSNKAVQNLAKKFKDRDDACIIAVGDKLDEELEKINYTGYKDNLIMYLNQLKDICSRKINDENFKYITDMVEKHIKHFSKNYQKYHSIKNLLIDIKKAETEMRNFTIGAYNFYHGSIRKLINQIDYSKLDVDILNNMKYVFCTLVTSGRAIFDNEIEYLVTESCNRFMGYNSIYETKQRTVQKKLQIGFDTLIIDEAGQAHTPELMIPTRLINKRVLLVGDHKQLPPVNFSNSDLEPYFHQINGRNVIQLKIQYRMHKDICEWPSRMFYNDSLKTDKSVLKRDSILKGGWGDKPLNFFHIDGKHETKDNSLLNKEEGKAIRDLINDIKFAKKSIGIICFYSAQVNYLKGMIKDVNINTVDSFQGSESDIIIISFTRTSGVGFLRDFRRLNVALTRAKHNLVIFGNKNSLRKSGDENIVSLIEHCEEKSS